jgi:hypothetical protein
LLDLATNHIMASEDQDLRACLSRIEKAGKHLGIKESEVKFAMNVLKSTADVIKAKDREGGNGEGSSKVTLTPDIYEAYRKAITSGGKSLEKGSGKKGKESKEGSMKKADSEENWGKWQRMGGDPRMHKLFDLSKAPYTPTESINWADPEHPDHTDDGKDGAGAKANTSIKMVPQMSPELTLSVVLLAEMDKLEINKKTKISTTVVDTAKGFEEEDDDTFIPNIARPPSERVELMGLLGAVPKHKNVESLRKLMSPVVTSSPLSNSPYLNALGSSGVAPPPGLYNSFSGSASSPESGFQSQHGSGVASTLGMANNLGMASTPGMSSTPGVTSNYGMANTPGTASTPGMTSNSGMVSTPSSGLPTQNPYQATMGNQSVTSSPLSHWSQPRPSTPTLGFYEKIPPSSDPGNMAGVRRTSLGHIARTASRDRAGMHSNVGNGTPLRADSPAFHSALGVAATRPPFPSPEFGNHVMGLVGVQGQQHDGTGVSGRTGSRPAGIYAQSPSAGMGSGADDRANADGLDAAARNLNKWSS